MLSLQKSRLEEVLQSFNFMSSHQIKSLVKTEVALNSEVK